MKYMLPIIIVGLLHCCESKAAPKYYSDPALALAASCVGESNWNGYETGECASIMFVYLKISKRTNRTLLDIAHAYSAAIKPRRNHPAPWKLDMNKEGYKPARWPHGINWNNYRLRWFRTLELARAFLRGEVADPTPKATYYGGPNDRPSRSLRRIETPENYKNYFYELKGVK